MHWLHSSLLVLFFISSAGHAETGESDLACANRPLLKNESFWGYSDNKPTVNCKFEKCFPKDINAAIPCDVRCLFTTDDGGYPEAVLRSFKEKVPVGLKGKPYFFVAYGPPASGKSNILKLLQKFYPEDFKELDKTTVSVNVDDIFQGGEVGKSRGFNFEVQRLT